MNENEMLKKKLFELMLAIDVLSVKKITQD